MSKMMSFTLMSIMAIIKMMFYQEELSMGGSAFDPHITKHVYIFSIMLQNYRNCYKINMFTYFLSCYTISENVTELFTYFLSCYTI